MPLLIPGLRHHVLGRHRTNRHENRKDHQNPPQTRGAGIVAIQTGKGHVADKRLADDAAYFSGGGGDAVRGAAVAGWEDLGGDDEGRCIGAEIERKLAQDVENDDDLAVV